MKHKSLQTACKEFIEEYDLEIKTPLNYPNYYRFPLSVVKHIEVIRKKVKTNENKAKRKKQRPTFWWEV